AERRADVVRVPEGVRVLRDLAYGSDPRQVVDVYRPVRPTKDAPVIVMVHGGGWRTGDKASARVIENKIERWVPRGIVVVSVDYRLLPVPLEQQRDDVRAAIAFVQRKAAEWGASGDRLVLMGHS